MRKAYQCPNCGEIDYLVSVEEEVHNYEIYPNGDGEKEYTGYSDVVDGKIEHILCVYCYTIHPETRLPEMVIDVEEEE